MKTHQTLAALCCAFVLFLSGWTALPVQAQDHPVDLADTVSAYMALTAALADDDVSSARAAAEQMDQALHAIDAGGHSWHELRDAMTDPLATMARDDADIEAVREQLQPLSTALEAAVRDIGYPGPLKRAYCPMAFDFEGAYWLQRDRAIINPYFGASMLRCGEIQAVIGQNGDDHQDHEHHDHDHGHHEHDHHDHAHHDDEEDVVDRMLGGEATTQYLCPMHPQIVRDGPDRCPICGMALVPRRQDNEGAATVSIHPAIQQAMNLRTAEVTRGQLEQPIHALGRIQVDESSLTRITPRTEGWIGDVGVASTGETVRSGQQLFTLYSRELVNVQDEFLQAVRGGRESQIDATRQRLEVLGVQPEVVERIREAGSPITWLPWYAPRDGYVAALNIRPGSFVQPGLDMLELADPSSIWLIAEVAGQSMQALAAGQHAHAQMNSHPGERLHGQVDLVYPEVNPTTRAAQARIVLDNPNGSLRLGDWAKVQIDGPTLEDVLRIPTEALIRTGTEERVVVQDDEQRFSARVVHAGIESGEYTEIRHGLDAGETVVVSGQFLIDSEASMRAGHARMDGHDHH